jgi:HTH-type transcriptional repressor of NAD biosynthesis genes
MKNGVVIGKFMPFHLGHKHLIDTALAGCDQLSILVADSPEYEPDIDTRMKWLIDTYQGRAAFIEVEVGDLDDDDSEGWARHTKETVGAFNPDPIDVVFTSESYGDPWAKALGCKHVEVDRARTTVPISGTEIRKNPAANLKWLPPAVRAYYVPRICVVGAESTGKTTLAKSLAEEFSVPWVPEFGRHYTEAMPDPIRHKWTRNDFTTIANFQRRFEDEAAQWADPLLVCDTCALTTGLFQEAYLGEITEAERREFANRSRYSLYVLTDLETPFEMDETGLRDEAKREWFHNQYIDLLQGEELIVVKGTREERVQQVKRALN